MRGGLVGVTALGISVLAIALAATVGGSVAGGVVAALGMGRRGVGAGGWVDAQALIGSNAVPEVTAEGVDVTVSDCNVKLETGDAVAMYPEDRMPGYCHPIRVRHDAAPGRFI